MAGLGGSVEWQLSPQFFTVAEPVCAFRNQHRDMIYWYLNLSVSPLKYLQCLNSNRTPEMA